VRILYRDIIHVISICGYLTDLNHLIKVTLPFQEVPELLQISVLCRDDVLQVSH